MSLSVIDIPNQTSDLYSKILSESYKLSKDLRLCRKIDFPDLSMDLDDDEIYYYIIIRTGLFKITTVQNCVLTRMLKSLIISEFISNNCIISGTKIFKINSEIIRIEITGLELEITIFLSKERDIAIVNT